MHIKSQKDFFTGLMFMGVGIAFAWGATRYSLASGKRQGRIADRDLGIAETQQRPTGGQLQGCRLDA